MDNDNIVALRKYRWFADLDARCLRSLPWDTRSFVICSLAEGIDPQSKICHLYYQCSQTILPRRHQAPQNEYTYEDYQDDFCVCVLESLTRLGYDVTHIAPDFVRGSVETFNEVVSLYLRHYDSSKAQRAKESKSKDKRSGTASTPAVEDHGVLQELPRQDAQPGKKRGPKSTPFGTGLEDKLDRIYRSIITDLPAELKSACAAIGLPYELPAHEVKQRTVLAISARRMSLLKAQLAFMELSLESSRLALEEQRTRTLAMTQAAEALCSSCHSMLNSPQLDLSLKPGLDRVVQACKRFCGTTSPHLFSPAFTTFLSGETDTSTASSKKRDGNRYSMSVAVEDLGSMVAPLKALLNELSSARPDPRAVELLDSFAASLGILQYTLHFELGQCSALATIDDVLYRAAAET